MGPKRHSQAWGRGGENRLTYSTTRRELPLRNIVRRSSVHPYM
jgi:hypothetical protein